MSSTAQLEQQIEELQLQHLNEMIELSKKYDAMIEELLESIKQLQQSIPKLVTDAVNKSMVTSMTDLMKEVAKETAMEVEKNFRLALEKKGKKNTK